MDFDNTLAQSGKITDSVSKQGAIKKYTCLRSKLKILMMRFAYPLIKIPRSQTPFRNSAFALIEVFLNV